MGLLPENKPQEFNREPRILFIWGDSMTGKTHLATKLPNPVLINTDGNCQKIATPSVYIKTWAELVQIIKELELNTNTFETIIFDLVEDLKLFLDEYIINEYNRTKKKEESDAVVLGDIGFGKGFAQSKSLWKQLIMRITKLDKNIVFISHARNTQNENVKEPALEKQYVNVLQGRCDLEIRTHLSGVKYMARVEKRRLNYTEEDFKDKRLWEVLKDVEYLSGEDLSVVKKATPKTTIETVEDIKIDEPIVIEEQPKKTLKQI